MCKPWPSGHGLLLTNCWWWHCQWWSTGGRWCHHGSTVEYNAWIWWPGERMTLIEGRDILLKNLTSSVWTGSHTQLLFIWWQLLQTHQRFCIGNQNGTKLCQPFSGQYQKWIFLWLKETKTRSSQTFHRWLSRCFFIQQRGTQPIHYFSQFFPPCCKIHLEIIRKFTSFSRYQTQSMATVYLRTLQTKWYS